MVNECIRLSRCVSVYPICDHDSGIQDVGSLLIRRRPSGFDRGEVMILSAILNVMFSVDVKVDSDLLKVSCPETLHRRASTYTVLKWC